MQAAEVVVAEVEGAQLRDVLQALQAGDDILLREPAGSCRACVRWRVVKGGTGCVKGKLLLQAHQLLQAGKALEG